MPQRRARSCLASSSLIQQWGIFFLHYDTRNRDPETVKAISQPGYRKWMFYFRQNFSNNPKISRNSPYLFIHETIKINWRKNWKKTKIPKLYRFRFHWLGKSTKRFRFRFRPDKKTPIASASDLTENLTIASASRQNYRFRFRSPDHCLCNILA